METKPSLLEAKAESHKAQQGPRLIPLTEWNKYHPWPPLGGLRHMAFFAETNGFNKVLRRVGRRVLIDEQAFFKYVDERNAESQQQKPIELLKTGPTK